MMDLNSEIEQQLIAAIGIFPDGASIENILSHITSPQSRRTIQRRLNDLKKAGKISTTGTTRKFLYHLPTQNNNWNDYHLSVSGAEILNLVQQPLTKRVSVGYNRAFLEDYQPNKTSYLSKKELKHLASLGNTARLNEPAGTYAKEILNRLLIDLSWNSSRLEGNTYSLLDTERLIASGYIADNKSAKEAQMILNHKDAIEFIVQLADEIGFNRYTLLNLHSLLSNNLLANRSAEGRLRNIPVGIQNSVYTPLAVPQLIEEMFDLMLKKASQIESPFEQAFFIMVHLPYLQPFDDVNKRVSRLASSIPLNKHNLAPLSFTDVSNELYTKGLIGIYELNRVELLKDVFLWAYEKSAAQYSNLRQSLGEPDPFRLKYHQQIRSIINAIITGNIPRNAVIPFLQNQSKESPANDREKLIEVIETELLSLHEGNFAKYQVRPSEFKKWKEDWNL